MPAQQRKPSSAQPATSTRKLFTRRVRAASVSYYVRLPGLDGRVAGVQRDAKMGDEITADAVSIMSLDSAGMLAPPDATREDVEREHAERIEAYRSARRGVAGVI